MRPARILVVDHDTWLRLLLSTWLADEGYDVVEADNGREALDQVHDQHPDVVLMEVDLPQRSGLAVLEELAHEEPTGGPPVILMNGSVDLAEVRQAPLAEAALNKPLDLGELLDQIRRSLAGRLEAPTAGHCAGCQCASTA
jgi:two-component system KDP operon response regulator KdpE